MVEAYQPYSLSHQLYDLCNKIYNTFNILQKLYNSKWFLVSKKVSKILDQ